MTLYRPSSAFAQPQRRSSFLTSIIKSYRLSPDVCTWHAMKLAVSMGVVPLLLFHFQAPSFASISSDQLILRCLLVCFTSSYQTILNQLNGVHVYHLFQNTPCPALYSFKVTLTKKGLKCVLGLATPQKSPITPTLLLQFKSHLDITTPADTAIWSLFTVAFFSFLRKSNLTISSPNSFDPTHYLCCNDIKFTSRFHNPRAHC